MTAIAVLGTAIIVSGSRGPLVAADAAVKLVVSHFLLTNMNLQTDFWHIAGVFAICDPVALVAGQLPTLDRVIPILERDLDSSSRSRFKFYVATVAM